MYISKYIYSSPHQNPPWPWMHSLETWKTNWRQYFDECLEARVALETWVSKTMDKKTRCSLSSLSSAMDLIIFCVSPPFFKVLCDPGIVLLDSTLFSFGSNWVHIQFQPGDKLNKSNSSLNHLEVDLELNWKESNYHLFLTDFGFKSNSILIEIVLQV